MTLLFVSWFDLSGFFSISFGMVSNDKQKTNLTSRLKTRNDENVNKSIEGANDPWDPAPCYFLNDGHEEKFQLTRQPPQKDKVHERRHRRFRR